MQRLLARVAFSASLALLPASTPKIVEAFVVASRGSSWKSSGKRLPRPRRLARDVRAEVGTGVPSASTIPTPPCPVTFVPSTVVTPRTERRERWRREAAATVLAWITSYHARKRPVDDHTHAERHPPARFDTVAAAGLCRDSRGGFDAMQSGPRAPTAGQNLTNGERPTVATRLASVGFLGQWSLLVLSTLLVSAVRRIFFAPKSSTGEEGNDMHQQQSQQAGIMNRCPWPFIFFHDPGQGFRDSATWVVVTWLTLRRLVKLASKAKAV